MTLRTDLKRVRLDRALTQQQLARAVGASRQTIVAIEAGRASPSTALALAICRELGCRIEDVFWIDEAGPLSVRVAAPLAGAQGAVQRRTRRRIARDMRSIREAFRTRDIDDRPRCGASIDASEIAGQAACGHEGSATRGAGRERFDDGAFSSDDGKVRVGECNRAAAIVALRRKNEIRAVSGALFLSTAGD